MRLLTPDLYVDSIFHIDLERLKLRNIKGLIIDIDNTLVGWDTKSATEEVKDWLLGLQQKGFQVCLVSNNTEDRVVKFNEALKLQAIHRATKPRRGAFRKAMKMMGTDLKSTAIIGDQIFTDVLGGNRMGIMTILVVPIKSKEFWWTTFVRKVERQVLKIVAPERQGD